MLSANSTPTWITGTTATAPADDTEVSGSEQVDPLLGKGVELEQIYRRSPNMVARRIGGEMILVPIRNNAGDLQCIYSLNEVGAFLWERIDGARSLGELAEAIQSEFDVSPDQAAGDLREFLAQLTNIGAVGVA